MKTTSAMDASVQVLIDNRNQEDSFFLVNVQDILNKHANWLLNLPRVRPFFAVKCNNTPLVLEIFVGLGLGFDCASKVEIETILAMGVNPSRIIYANPCKTRSYIRHAAANNVDLMTFDNEDELYKIAQLFPSARLIIRIKVDDSHSVCRFSAKFGVPLERCSYLLKLARTLGLNVVGVSFHVGSGCESAKAYSDAIANARFVFTMGQELGFSMKILDLGGGFPGSANTPVNFEEIAAVINTSLDIHFPQTDIDIIAEPGRYYVASAFTLMSAVIAKRISTIETGEKMAMYYLNDGVYGSFNCTIFDHLQVYPTIDHCQARVNRQCMMTTFWGPTCDSMDMIKKDFIFPELDVGDWVTFPDMGAYTLVAASSFNGFPLPTMHFVAKENTVNALRRLSTWPNVRKLLGIDDEIDEPAAKSASD